jgi:hypothetical protein
VVPLPLDDKPTGLLKAYDESEPGEIPTLPDETTVAPYQVQFVLTLESGLSRILSQAADEDYTLTPFERLSLSGVEIQPRASDG